MSNGKEIGRPQSAHWFCIRRFSLWSLCSLFVYTAVASSHFISLNCASIASLSRDEAYFSINSPTIKNFRDSLRSHILSVDNFPLEIPDSLNIKRTPTTNFAEVLYDSGSGENKVFSELPTFFKRHVRDTSAENSEKQKLGHMYIGVEEINSSNPTFPPQKSAVLFDSELKHKPQSLDNGSFMQLQNKIATPGHQVQAVTPMLLESRITPAQLQSKIISDHTPPKLSTTNSESISQVHSESKLPLEHSNSDILPVHLKTKIKEMRSEPELAPVYAKHQIVSHHTQLQTTLPQSIATPIQLQKVLPAINSGTKDIGKPFKPKFNNTGLQDERSSKKYVDNLEGRSTGRSWSSLFLAVTIAVVAVIGVLFLIPLVLHLARLGFVRYQSLDKKVGKKHQKLSDVDQQDPTIANLADVEDGFEKMP